MSRSQEAYALVTCALCPTEFFRRDRSAILIENHRQQPNGESTSCFICPACAVKIRENDDPHGQIKNSDEIREHVKMMRDYTEGVEEAFEDLRDELEQTQAESQKKLDISQKLIDELKREAVEAQKVNTGLRLKLQEAEAATEEAETAKAELQRKLQEAEEMLEKEQGEKAELQTTLLAAKNWIDESRQILPESDENIDNLRKKNDNGNKRSMEEWKLRNFSKIATQSDNCDRISDNCDRTSVSEGSEEVLTPFTKIRYNHNECDVAIQALKMIQDTTDGAAGVQKYGRTKPEDKRAMMEEAEDANSLDENIEMLHRVAHLPHMFSDLYLSLYKWTLVHKKTVGFNQQAYRDDVLSAASAGVIFQTAADPLEFHLSKHANMILSLRGLDKSRKPRQIWCDWLYVARTDYTKKGPISYGLFSCRRFQKGETIGPYVGNIVWEKTCSKEEMEARQPQKEARQPLFPALDEEVVKAASKMKGFVQTTKESIRIVSPLVRAEREVETRLLMGFEFMTQDDKNFNVKVTNEGLVQPTKVLRKDDELIVAPLSLKGD